MTRLGGPLHTRQRIYIDSLNGLQYKNISAGYSIVQTLHTIGVTFGGGAKSLMIKCNQNLTTPFYRQPRKHIYYSTYTAQHLFRVNDSSA